MKKFMTLLIAVLIGVGVASARDRVTTDVKELPVSAQNTLKQHFKNIAVNHIKIDDGIFSVDDYSVVLENGTEVEFDGDGSLKEVDAGINTVPASIMPKQVVTYIRNNFKNGKIICYEVKRNGYEVELNNGLEVKFDRNGNFKSLDH